MHAIEELKQFMVDQQYKSDRYDSYDGPSSQKNELDVSDTNKEKKESKFSKPDSRQDDHRGAINRPKSSKFETYCK